MYTSTDQYLIQNVLLNLKYVLRVIYKQHHIQYTYTDTTRMDTFEPQICLFSECFTNRCIYRDTNTIKYVNEHSNMFVLRVTYKEQHIHVQIQQDWILLNTQICLFLGWLHVRDHQVRSSLRVQQSETPRQVGRAQNHQVTLSSTSSLSYHHHYHHHYCRQ